MKMEAVIETHFIKCEFCRGWGGIKVTAKKRTFIASCPDCYGTGKIRVSTYTPTNPHPAPSPASRMAGGK